MNRFDKLSVHPVSGPIMFLGVLLLTFQAVFSWSKLPAQGINWAVNWLSAGARSAISSSYWASLIADGIIGGTGSVLVFLPYVIILSVFTVALEKSGYLARAATFLARLFGRFGVNGASVFPLMSCFVCAVPGISSTQAITCRRGRLTAVIMAPLITCSGRLPIYTLLISAFIPEKRIAGVLGIQGVVLFGFYILGIGASLITGALLRKIRPQPPLADNAAALLPPMKFPPIREILSDVSLRAYDYIHHAGIAILACSIAVWFLSRHPINQDIHGLEAIQSSYLASAGKALEPVFRPIGLDWKMGTSVISSLAGREAFVSSMALLNGAARTDASRSSLVHILRHAADPQSGAPKYNLAVALSVMVFFTFSGHCLATLIASYHASRSWKVPATVVLYTSALAYIGSFVVYQAAIRF